MRHNNEELAASWGNLVNRVANLMNKNFGEIPALDEASMTDEDRALLAETAGAFDSIGSLIENHRQKNALSEAMRVVGDINKYISATEPWKIKDNPACRRPGRVRCQPPAGSVPAALRAESVGGAGRYWHVLAVATS